MGILSLRASMYSCIFGTDCKCTSTCTGHRYPSVLEYRYYRYTGTLSTLLNEYCTSTGNLQLYSEYWHAKHENRKCCPQHGALNAMSAGLAFSAVTTAVSEPFLQPAAENWSPVGRHILVPWS